jgi:hypothetical protein
MVGSPAMQTRYGLRQEGLTDAKNPRRYAPIRPLNAGASGMATSASEEAPESVFVVREGAIVAAVGLTRAPSRTFLILRRVKCQRVANVNFRVNVVAFRDGGSDVAGEVEGVVEEMRVAGNVVDGDLALWVMGSEKGLVAAP